MYSIHAPKILMIAILMLQAWLGCIFGQVRCVPVAACDTHAQAPAPSCADHGHEHQHSHGPVTPTDDHHHDDCGCHVHLLESFPVSVTAPGPGTNFAQVVFFGSAYPAVIADRIAPDPPVLAAPTRPPNRSCLAQAQAIRATILLI